MNTSRTARYISRLIVGYCVIAPLQAMAQPPTDYLGDPLPAGAVARLGTERMRHPGEIRVLRFTDDNKHLLSFGYEGEAIAWNVETGRRVNRDSLPTHLQFNDSLLSPDRKFVAVLNEDATVIELLDKATGKYLLVRKNPALWSHLAFKRDGKTLLALSCDNVVTAWDIASGKEISTHRFDLVPGPRTAGDYPQATLAEDGSTLAGILKEDAKNRGGPARVHFWDPCTGKEIYQPIVLSRLWKEWSLSPDGKHLTVQYWDSEMQLWEVETGKKTQIAKGSYFGEEGVLHIRDKKRSVISAWESVYLRDLDSNKILWQKRVTPPNVSGPRLKNCRVNRFALSPDGKTVAAGTDNGYIELLDLATGQPVGASRLHPGFFTEPFRFVADSKLALVMLGDKYVLWDLAQGQKIRELDFEFVGEEDIHLSPDGRRLFRDDYEKDGIRLLLLDVLSGKELWSRKQPRDQYVDVCFADDNQMLAIFHPLGPDVKFVSTTTGQDARTFQPRIREPKTGNDIPAGNLLAVSPTGMAVMIEKLNQGAIQLWDSKTAKQLWTWTMPDRSRYAPDVHFVPGEKYILVEIELAPRREVFLYQIDAKTGKPLHNIKGAEFRGVSPDGRFMAFETSAGEHETYLEVRDLEFKETVLKEKHRAGYRGRYVAFSADSRILACNLDDVTIEFVDLQTKQRLGPPRQHTAHIRQMIFAPSGSILAACYNDSTVIHWDAKSQSP